MEKQREKIYIENYTVEKLCELQTRCPNIDMAFGADKRGYFLLVTLDKEKELLTKVYGLEEIGV